MITGGCRCGNIRYEAEGDSAHHALCHCRDCQMGSGAPMVAWIAFRSDSFRITRGEPSAYNGSGKSIRNFCGNCGTPLFFFNEDFLPGIVDIQTVTLDDPDEFAPTAHVQVAERRKWMETVSDLPEFERFPGG
ncbi:GFA family protein [Alteraurantiacibacter aestuarii]|uniref:GFA family protein n=1 Tax=Alteraurantiacibacter aestuarii TaxID=650004 RepID=A0A844ZLK0_9SPHN|nr:GFA family protein [Alteraurantiacibacter aestuarii]MXO88648.1 GFA family protein [Alteraurantiacibacter aestuarii]